MRQYFSHTRQHGAFRLRDYLLALLFVALAIGLDLSVSSFLRRAFFFLPLAAITVSAVLGGYGPGVFATLLAAVGLDYFLIEPRFEFGIMTAEHGARLLFFLPVGMLVTWVGGRLRSALNGAEESLSKLQEERLLRERMIAGLSHDLRNPLSVARTMAELGLRRGADPEARASSFAKIIESIERADRMIQDLLDLSRARSGRPLELRPEELDLARLLERIVADYQAGHGDRIRLVKSLEKPIGCWDRAAIRRIVENLLLNALKYGARAEPVEVRLGSAGGGNVEISVHNWGSPIPPEALPELFEQFTRARSDRRGWGLGLSVVKILAEAQGGSVSVQSSAEKGTTFSVVLPASSVRSIPCSA